MYKCECGNKFSREDNLKRHKKLSCPLKKQDNNININMMNNNVINSNNNNIVLVNPIINISIIPINKEGINDLSVMEWGQVLCSNKNIFMEILEKVNCENPLHHNIYYDDVKSGYGLVYKNDKLKMEKIENILTQFIDYRILNIKEIIKILQSILKNKYVNYVIKILEGLEKNSTQRKKLISNLKPILYNYSNKILQSMKQNNLCTNNIRKKLLIQNINNEDDDDDIDIQIYTEELEVNSDE